APLEEIANPMVTTDPAKAPWYFVGLQELLEHMHPLLAGVLIPSALILFLVILPYLDTRKEGVGAWFSNSRGKRIAGGTAVYTLVSMAGYILLDNAFSLRELLRERAPQWVAQGLLPALILTFLVALPVMVVRAAGGRRHEVFLALFTVMLTAATVFTVSGFLFRGPGFRLYTPWEMPGGYNPWDGL
ncbi:MAG TPA: cytochrome B6, partial [Candidatus Methylomirabilis sp.]